MWAPHVVSDDGLQFDVSEVRGDGRCLFRAVVRSLWLLGVMSDPTPRRKWWQPRSSRAESRRFDAAEAAHADRLRLRAVKTIQQHEDLFQQFMVIETGRSFNGYLRRMKRPKTYGGEPELFAITKILKRPVLVYKSLRLGGVTRIQSYGEQYVAEPVRLLYSPGGPHYDALVAYEE